MKRTTRTNAYADWLLIALALAFQLLLSPKIHGNEVRVATADLLLPFLAYGMFLSWSRQGPDWIQWRQRGMWLWLAVLSLWLGVALLRGMMFTGSVQAWALVNKFIGWFVLLAFFVTGAWLARTASDDGRQLFAKVFVITAVVIGLTDYWPYVQTMRGYDLYMRMSGVAGNPNAFGYLVSAVIVVGLAFMHRAPLFGRRWDGLIIGFLISLVVLSGSRSAWLSLLFGLLLLLAARSIRPRLLLTGALVAALLVFSVNSVRTLEDAGREYLETEYSVPPASKLGAYISRQDMLSQDSGVSHRLAITRDALALWKQHPIEGVGLGGFVWHGLQQGKTSTIHNTGLWLLTETGLVGILLYSGFFLAAAWAIWRGREQSRGDPLVLGGLATLFVFLGASVGMEAMYQRHVWFLAGWALAAVPSDPELRS